MGMTLSEKILANHVGRKGVEPGEILNVPVDLALANDITAAPAIREFERIGVERVWDRDRLALVPSHFTPAKDIRSAQQTKVMRDFARAQQITHFFEIGEAGIEHALLPEVGLELPGEVIIGADSHTCTGGALGAFATGVGSTDLAAVMATGHCWLRVPETLRVIYKGRRNPWVVGKDLILHLISRIGVEGGNYMALEYCGPVIDELPMSDRFTMANMAVEAGAKAGLIAPDGITLAYVEGRAKHGWHPVWPDRDARYAETLELDVTHLQPQVAEPSLPSKTKDVGELADVEVDQAFIGSCTNARIEDLRIAAYVLRGHKVHPRTRLIVIPATQEVYRQALREGLIEVFMDAGAAVSTPGCGPCLGGYMGVLAAGEVCISTSNRNFRGRMGHPDARPYLASPAVAAASAVLGRIAHPDEVVRKEVVA